MHFKSNIQNLNFLTLQQIHLPNGLPAVRPGSTMARAPVFYTIKLIVSDLRNRCSKEHLFNAPWCFLYPLLVSFHLQIAYGKVRNSQIGVNKLVGQVLINLLCHAKFIASAACVISIIINAPAVSCTLNQIDLQEFFVTTAAFLCQRVVANKQM